MQWSQLTLLINELLLIKPYSIPLSNYNCCDIINKDKDSTANQL